ncbi:MAG TPA: serine/threonine-protein kinase, partial [Verrucomicrobiae bacterium]|nr:serine/threonine-protein kinase [Verrucomicrobiae bacterium]
MSLEPILAASEWMDDLTGILIVLVVFCCVFVVPVAGIVAIVYFIVNLFKSKPAPAPTLPVPQPAMAQKSSLQPMPVAKTEVMPRKCPQCGAELKPDAPEGLCPACLLQRGIATEAGAPSGQSSFVPPSFSELSQLFPQLEILEMLGRGGMGAVYKARQPRLDRLVALKILAPEKQNDPQFAERFEREARALARLNHPNIVTVYDFGEVQGRFYLLMEFVDGLTLRQVLQHGKLSPSEALALVPKICDALQYAHEQGIVHRDIKPENILLDKQGKLKIADFGIAKIAGMGPRDFSLTGARDVMGTPHYMAPEQVEHPQSVDHRADIYSLGVVFYEMLTGELPLGKFAPPSKKVQVDVRLDEVVLHALEKEPARRYQQASQVKTAVETIAGTQPPVAATPMAASAGNLSLNTAVITAPAVALMIAGLWKMLSALLNGLFLLPGGLAWLDKFIGGSFFSGW